jgi:hypothetical protein
MGKRFNNIKEYHDQKVYFIWNGEEACWLGDYGIRTWGEDSDWDYPGDCETEITIHHTERIETWSEELEDWVELIPTDEMLEEVKFEIEKSL